MDQPLPDLQQALNLFRTLTGKQLTAKAIKELPAAGASGPLFAGLYVADGEEKSCGALLIDFTLAVSLSGTLVGLPAAVITQQLKSREVTEMLTANLTEVVNVAGALYNATGAPHVRLRNIEEVKAKPAGELGELLATPGLRRLDLEITIPQCPPGKISFVRK